MPGIVATGIYIFITAWNEYLFAMILAGDNVRTVTVALQLFIGEFQIQWGLLTAGGTLVALPVTILFLIVQRRLVSGLTAGAVKGMTMTNPIGIISMFYARPFTREHFALLRAHQGAPAATSSSCWCRSPANSTSPRPARRSADAGLGVVLAARVNLDRDLASDDPAAHAGRRRLSRRPASTSPPTLGAAIVGGPLYGAPLVFAGRAPAPVAEDERRAADGSRSSPGCSGAGQAPRTPACSSASSRSTASRPTSPTPPARPWSWSRRSARRRSA